MISIPRPCVSTSARGLITPQRSDGNTRLYDDGTLERLEAILTLTRDLGVNLAGVEVILNMREQMESLQIETDRLLAFVKQEMLDRKVGVDRKYAWSRCRADRWPPRRARNRAPRRVEKGAEESVTHVENPPRHVPAAC